MKKYRKRNNVYIDFMKLVLYEWLRKSSKRKKIIEPGWYNKYPAYDTYYTLVIINLKN
jgi:hypothetical protein